MYRRSLFAGLFSVGATILLGSLAHPARAEELTLHVDAIGPRGPTPYKTQLRVQITNESFTSTPLLEKVNASELLIDGHPYKRRDKLFRGPSGLAAKESWEGCLKDTDFLPQGLAPGPHRLQWQLGGVLSEEIHVKWPEPSPAVYAPKDRLRQVKVLRESLVPGLLRSCVENWLKEKDGGLAESDAVRYYVDPGVKVLVPYDPSGPESRVKGPVKVYLESPAMD